MARGTVEERFWSKVNKTESCWLWTACLTRGHGQFALQHGERVKAHRWAYASLVGPIPAGHYIDHLCRNRSCVNPAHLEPVTPLVNVRRGNSPTVLRGRAAMCINGHPHNEANRFVDRRGYADCWLCKQARDARRRRVA